VLLIGLAITAATVSAASPADARNVVTPGNFTGYAFDQCLAPTQRAMDAWLKSSPYLAVGIYISGASRGCVHQPNLSARWVANQLRNGWRLLPITLGPQAWCTTRERYLHQVRINPSPRSAYTRARSQGRAEARKTVRAAERLGISRRSTLWYDIEAFPIGSTHCRESALSFLNAWTRQLHQLHYVSGVYSSAASGIKILDDARALRPGKYLMPDRIWIADWNGRRNTASGYVRQAGWQPHRRVHQYVGGHHERHGGVTIDVDRNWVDLGRGSWTAAEPAHCGGKASYNFRSYRTLRVGTRGPAVRAAQCLLRALGRYVGKVDGVYDAGVVTAVRKYRVSRGMSTGGDLTQRTWVALLSHGPEPVLKLGSANPAVRRMQRALNAADHAGLPVSGRYGWRTLAAVRHYQRDHHKVRTGVTAPYLWRMLHRGTR
jgi:peptidoglycan hydrolase-like protein with peptidoglycan-binding domain